MVMIARHSLINTAHFDQDILALLSRVGREDILPHFRNLDKKDVDTKASDTDFVTIADRQAEKHLIAGLKNLLPEARFVAEENTALHGLPEALESGYVWTIDPLDGTRNFVKGDEQFCSMLGLLYDGQPVAAWIYKPLSGEAVIAHHGQRPRYITGNGEGRECSYSGQDKRLDEMRGNMNAMGFPIDIRDRVREKLKTLKGRFHVGSAGVEAMNIACATSDYLMHSKLTYWDSVPVVMVMQALGHHVRLAPGGLPYQPGDKGVLLAAPSAVIWQELADFVWSV